MWAEETEAYHPPHFSRHGLQLPHYNYCQSQTSCQCPRTVHSAQPTPEALQFHNNPDPRVGMKLFHRLSSLQKASLFLKSKHFPIMGAYTSLFTIFFLNPQVSLGKLDMEGGYWKTKSEFKLKLIFQALQSIQKCFLALAELRVQWWKCYLACAQQLSLFYSYTQSQRSMLAFKAFRVGESLKWFVSAFCKS